MVFSPFNKKKKIEEKEKGIEEICAVIEYPTTMDLSRTPRFYDFEFKPS